MIHALVGDVVFDHLHAAGVAQEFVLAHDLGLAFFLRDHHELRGVEALADAAALADVCTNFHVSHGS